MVIFFQTFDIFFSLFTCFVLLVCLFVLLCFCCCRFFFHFWTSYTTWPDSEGWSATQTLKLKSDGVTFYYSSAFEISGVLPKIFLEFWINFLELAVFRSKRSYLDRSFYQQILPCKNKNSLLLFPDRKHRFCKQPCYTHAYLKEA